MAKKNSKNNITVGFTALGCPKAIVDSEKMLGEIAQAGLVIVEDIDRADVVVINTCGFIEPARQEALDVIRQAAAWKDSGNIKKIIVTGCLPQRLGDELFKLIGQIDAIVGLEQRDDIADIIKQTIRSDSSAGYMSSVCSKVSDDRSRLLITPGHCPYLRISDGCDHKCSFCTIPAIRGTFRSKTQQNILAEAAELTDAGAVELSLIAQDTAYYGKDLKIKNALIKLIAELEKIEFLKWIRLMYMYPVGITPELIETIAVSEKIVHYLDIPIQHINDDILKAMRRPDTKKHICQLIEKLRKAVPDIILRTTVIVGFPGETDEQFCELIDFIKWAEFDALGTFPYYPESGTVAAEMAGQIPKEVKQQRIEQLMLTQQQIAFAKNQQRVGSRLVCLVDSVESQGQGRGRFYGQAPDIDSICIIKNCSALAGHFVEVEVIGTEDYDLIVRQI